MSIVLYSNGLTESLEITSSNSCFPVTSALAAAPQLHLLQLLLPIFVHFSCCSPIASADLLLPDCIHLWSYTHNAKYSNYEGRASLELVPPPEHPTSITYTHTHTHTHTHNLVIVHWYILCAVASGIFLACFICCVQQDHHASLASFALFISAVFLDEGCGFHHPRTAEKDPGPCFPRVPTGMQLLAYLPIQWLCNMHRNTIHIRVMECFGSIGWAPTDGRTNCDYDVPTCCS